MQGEISDCSEGLTPAKGEREGRLSRRVSDCRISLRKSTLVQKLLIR